MQETSKRTAIQWAEGLLTLFVGLVIAHLGVTLFLIAELGSDTFTIFIQGLAKTCGLSIGTCHVIILILLMVVMAIFTKGYVTGPLVQRFLPVSKRIIQKCFPDL